MSMLWWLGTVTAQGIWQVGFNYSARDMVTGSDGCAYVANHPSIGINPVGNLGVDWTKIAQVGPSVFNAIIDVTGARVIATDYINGAANTIWVQVNTSSVVAGILVANVTVGGVVTAYSTDTVIGMRSVGFPVPSGATYRVDDTTGGLVSWFETN